MAYAIDTAAAISDLEEAGAEPAVARAIVRTVASVGDELATKSDLAALKADIATLKADIAALKADTVASNAEHKVDIADLRTALTVRIVAT